MSVKIFAELNPWSSKRILSEVEPGSIKDIITRLNTDWPLSQARVCKNGEIVKDFSVLARDGDELAVKFVPYGSTSQQGGGMKVAGWALMIAGGVLMASGYGAAIGIAVMGCGLGLTLGGQALLGIKIPNVKNPDNPETDPSIRGAKNQARPHGRIPVLFGRHRIYPDLAANSYSEIIDGKQYYTQLFCGGYKDCVIDNSSFKLGDTPLIDFSHTKNINSILTGADPAIRLEILQNGEASDIYPYCVHEETFNTPLTHEIEGADGQMLSGEVISKTPAGTTKIDIDIFFYNGLGKYKDNGELEETSVEVRASYKLENSDQPWKVVGYFKAVKGGSDDVITGSELKMMRCNSNTDYLYPEGLPPGKYSVKIERVTPDSTDSKVVDQVYLGSIRSYKSARPIRYDKQKDLTVIAMRVLAIGNLNNVLDSFNYEATAKFPVYSGNGSGPSRWQQTAETKNPASALLYALQGKAAQQKVANDDIDWQSLEKFYLWCEEHEYYCNAYLSQSVTMSELTKLIGLTSRAEILRIDSKISVVQDIQRPAHLQLFTPKNSIDYKITMIKADIPDALSLRFIDEDAGYAQNEAKIFNTWNWEREDEPDTDQKIDLWGVTNNKQARRIGMYNYACMKNRPFVHTIEVDIEYLIVNKGDWIQYAGDIALAGTTQGRIKGLIYIGDICVGIDTDEPIEMTEGNQYAVRIRTSNGTILLEEVVFSPGILRERDFTYYPTEGNEDLTDPSVSDMYAVDENNYYYEPENIIRFVEPFGENDVKPKAGDIYAFGVRGYEVIDLIITEIQPGRDFTATLTCVEYAPEIFGVDEPDFILPPFINKITPFSGAVDSGVVNPSDWKLFSVFNESITEPPRPAGDGTNDGWHYTVTRNSIWQSTKMAPRVDTGEWGPPVNLKGRDGVTPIFLTVSPQSKLLECDIDGNPLVGVLPFTSQARLFNGNTLVTEDITWSVPSAPPGISVNNSGLVTVAAGATLSDETAFTVRARYQNVNYDVQIYLTKEKQSSSPRYLGTVSSLTVTNAAVSINKGEKTGPQTARQNDFILATSAVAGQPAGSVFQLSVVPNSNPTRCNWIFRNATNFAELYMRCFKDGLEIMSLQNNTEWFGAVICQQLIAQKAFIENLMAGFISFKHSITSEAKDLNGEPLIAINGQTGSLKVFEAVIKGNSYFEGDIFSGPLELTSINPSNLDNTNHWATGASTAHVYNYFKSLGIRTPVDGIYANIPFANFELKTFYWKDLSTIYLAVYNRNWNPIEVPLGYNSSQNQNTEDGVRNMILLKYSNNTNTFTNLSYNMTVGVYNPSGKTFRLKNLPRNEPSVQYAIWVDSSGYLRIKM